MTERRPEGDTAVTVEGVSKRFRVYRERNQSLKAAIMRRGRARYDDFWALRDVSFTIPRGSTFGLVGENGSGKSTLLKCIARILQPDAGSIRASGRLGALLELGSGFHPELTGRENVYLNGSILGLSRRQIDQRFDAIVDFSGVERFIDQPVKNYSSGMYVRLGFSVAINIEPEILLVDEVLAVGDSAFQRKCLDKFADYRRQGRTVVIVSHAMGSMRSMCDEVVWLEGGRVRDVGAAADVVDGYMDDSDETHEVLAGGGHRAGSGEIRIEHVLVRGGEGGSGRVAAGKPLTVTLWYHAHERVERPSFGLGVETREGVLLWGNNTMESGLTIDHVEGRGSVTFACPWLPFQGHSFDLLASATDRTSAHVYDFLREVVTFDADRPRPVQEGGPVALDASWRHKPGDVAEPGQPGLLDTRPEATGQAPTR